MQIKTTMNTISYPGGWLQVKNTDNNMFWQGCGGTGTLTDC
jgi:hypothetical protein